MNLLSWRYVPLMLFIILVLFLGYGLMLDPQKLPSTRIGQPVPGVVLPILGHEDHQTTSDAWKGQPYLLHVWASWCDACIEDQAFMMQLANQGIRIYGLTYKDDVKAALKWLKRWGNPYQETLDDASGLWAIELGVYGTPETFLVDEKGVIRYRHTGLMNEALWIKKFKPLMSGGIHAP